MEPEQHNGQAVRIELERILSSAPFVRNERQSGLLRFLVERHLEGRDTELKESLVAVEVFGRKPDYDPKHDAIVRTEAARLRARLNKYYAGDGRSDPLVIDLPKGGYVPEFRPHEAVPESTAILPEQRQAWLGMRPWLTVALAGFVLILAAIGLWRGRHKSPPVPIAVLPFVNLSPDPADDYFADGLTGEIIRNLSIIDGLAVRSQTSSFAFKGKPRNVRDVGKQLAADYILEGSVLRGTSLRASATGKLQLRINAQFIRVRDDFPLWSGRYNREVTDVFAIQDEISRSIVNSLRLKLGRGRRRYETSTEAYDSYLRARALAIQGTMDGFGQSVAPLEEAIAKDPSFAPAYAGLAAAHAYRSGLFRLNPSDEVPKMRAAADKAIQLDPMLAEGHDALGMAYARDAQWEQSEKSFRRAIELEPNRSETRHHFATFLLWPLERTREAVMELRLADTADPLSPRIRRALCYVLPSVGRYDEAAGHCEKLAADFPGRSAYLGRARFWQGRTAEAIQILETAFHQGVTAGSEIRGFLGYAYAQTGRRAEAEKMAAGTNPFNQAVIFAGLGEKERALEAMERGAAAGPFRVGRQLTWPELVLIRGDPRLKALHTKVGLPK